MALSLSNAVCGVADGGATLLQTRCASRAGRTFLGTQLVARLCMLLRTPQTALATAQILLVRFFAVAPSSEFAVADIALACVLLACKVEEVGRRVADVVNVYFALKLYEASDHKETAVFVDVPYETMNEYKDAIIKGEIHILARLGFNVHVQHPHGFMVNYLKSLGLASDKELAQFCWNCLNDVVRTEVVVYYQPNVIACAAIYYGACKFGVILPVSPPWWELFDASLVDIEIICEHLAALYARDV